MTAHLIKTNYKKTSRGKRLEIRGNFPNRVCKRRKSPVFVMHRFHFIGDEHDMRERREHLSHHSQTPKTVRSPVSIN
jgi:hypothetical protein